jgi:hypothetical protein
MPRRKTANKWTVETVKLVDVKPFEGNPRTIKSARMAALRASLERFGYVDLIVWNKKTGNIVGGHQRYKILVESGVREAKMIVVEMSEKEELAANLTLNNPNIEGKWDDPIEELLGRIETVDPELFTDANFDDLRDAVVKMAPDPGKDDTDTECPCCSHRWKIDDKDVVVMTRDEQEVYADADELR